MTDLTDRKLKMLVDVIGSCDCCTKTPDYMEHEFTCRYHKIMVEYHMIEQIKEKQDE
jgi:hypothetical protein